MLSCLTHTQSCLPGSASYRVKSRGSPSGTCSATSLNRGWILSVRRHEKLKGPKGLSQKAHDTAVIHSQASLRPCIRQRGITHVFTLFPRTYRYPANVDCNRIHHLRPTKTRAKTVAFDSARPNLYHPEKSTVVQKKTHLQLLYGYWMRGDSESV